MCLAINIPKGTELKWDLLETAYENNSDGFGLMYFTKDYGIHVHKIVPKTWQDVKDVLLKYEYVLKSTNLALHFRWRTHGAINEANSHPYTILSKEQDGRDVMLVHNGTITNAPEFDSTMSDTWHFIEYFLKPIVKANACMLDTDNGRKALAALMDKFSQGDRFILMDGNTRQTILVNGLNKNSEWPEVWLSNTYSLRRTTSYYYQGGSGVSDWSKSNSGTAGKCNEGGKGSPLAGKQTVSIEGGSRVVKGEQKLGDALTVSKVQNMSTEEIFLGMSKEPAKWLAFCYKLVEDHYAEDELSDASTVDPNAKQSA